MKFKEGMSYQEVLNKCNQQARFFIGMLRNQYSFSKSQVKFEVITVSKQPRDPIPTDKGYEYDHPVIYPNGPTRLLVRLTLTDKQ